MHSSRELIFSVVARELSASTLDRHIYALRWTYKMHITSISTSTLVTSALSMECELFFSFEFHAIDCTNYSHIYIFWSWTDDFSLSSSASWALHENQDRLLIERSETARVSITQCDLIVCARKRSGSEKWALSIFARELWPAHSTFEIRDFIDAIRSRVNNSGLSFADIMIRVDFSSMKNWLADVGTGAPRGFGEKKPQNKFELSTRDTYILNISKTERS